MIKASALLAKVIELGERRPDERRKCTYVNDDGTPCCIVGEAFIELGVSPQIFLDDPDLNGETGINSLVRWNHPDLHLENDITDEERRKLSDTQNAQDNGHNWGEAIVHLR